MVSVNSKSNLFRELILAEKSVTEDDVWSKFKWGKHEALSTCWGFRKKGNAEDYLWVQFERTEDGIGSYVLKGQGAEQPAEFIDRSKKKNTEEVAE